MEEPTTPPIFEPAKEPEQTATPTMPIVPAKKPSKAGYIIMGAVIALLAAAGVVMYLWTTDQSTKQKTADAAKIADLQNQITALKAEKADTKTDSAESDQAAEVPSASDKENIIASITSGNTAALVGYMASSVHVVIAASESANDRTPAKAVEDLSYISGATAPWDFNLSAATLAGYAERDYKAYFKANSVVGKSADARVVVFNFDAAGKINGIFMSASDDIL